MPTSVALVCSAGGTVAGWLAGIGKLQNKMNSAHREAKNSATRSAALRKRAQKQLPARRLFSSLRREIFCCLLQVARAKLHCAWALNLCQQLNQNSSRLLLATIVNSSSRARLAHGAWPRPGGRPKSAGRAREARRSRTVSLFFSALELAARATSLCLRSLLLLQNVVAKSIRRSIGRCFLLVLARARPPARPPAACGPPRSSLALARRLALARSPSWPYKAALGH